MASLVALAGFMGSGKSVVGNALAKQLGASFVDLDHAIERRLGVPIAEFFRTDGEAAFRAVESEVLVSVLRSMQGDDVVLALGGGTLESADNRRIIKDSGVVAFLDTSSERAWHRVMGSDRPLAQDETTFMGLWSRRRRTYEEAADWIMPTEGRDVDELAIALAELIALNEGRQRILWARRLAETSRQSLIVGAPGAIEILHERAAAAAEGGVKLHVITDANVWSAWGEKVGDAVDATGKDVFVMKPGEQSKSVAVLGRCWEWMAARNARRQDVVVALGGGVVGDLAGFLASTYHRGVGLWQVPTTLLAQVDSSVGGKTAINLTTAKNLVGAFYQADLVVIDPETLQTLPDIEYVGAFGEVIKHALLSSYDALAALEASVEPILDRDADALSELIKRNVWLKTSVVEEDEKEAGKRASLNLGHTVGHALEVVVGYGKLTHGQAVGLGLLVALAASEELLGLDVTVRERTETLMSLLGMQTKTELPSASAIMAAADHDKKASSGNSGFVGLREVGEAVWGLDLPAPVLARSLGVIER